MKEGEKRLLLVKVAEKRIFSRRRGWHSMAQMTQQKLHLKLIFLSNKELFENFKSRNFGMSIDIFSQCLIF